MSKKQNINFDIPQIVSVPVKKNIYGHETPKIEFCSKNWPINMGTMHMSPKASLIFKSKI